MDRWTLLGMGLILTLCANIIVPFLIKAETTSSGGSHPQQIQILTDENTKRLSEQLQVAKAFYESLRLRKYKRVYQMMHPQVQAEVSEDEFIKNLSEAINKDNVEITGYKLGTEKNYELWRSPFDPKKRTYRNVREIEVVLTGNEKDKPFRLPGVLILAPLPDGSWRVLRQ